MPFFIFSVMKRFSMCLVIWINRISFPGVKTIPMRSKRGLFIVNMWLFGAQYHNMKSLAFIFWRGQYCCYCEFILIHNFFNVPYKSRLSRMCGCSRTVLQPILSEYQWIFWGKCCLADWFLGEETLCGQPDLTPCDFFLLWC